MATSKINYVFLGGVFCEAQLNFISENSIGVIQNAADVLQKNMILGFDQNLSSGIAVINLPFVGSYPRRFRRLYFPSTQETIGVRSNIFGVGFLNVFFFKLLFRYISALRGLFSLKHSGNTVLFIYSAHLPFLLSALAYRMRRPAVRICLIIPDLPEYMGSTGFFSSIFKKIDIRLFYYCVKKLDYFVVLTEMMISRLGVDPKKAVVIEGIASDKVYSNENMFDGKSKAIRSFLYTGTLARRYGITTLIDAFEQLTDDDIELWICGEGDSKDYISQAAERDKRIKYFGQIGRDEVVMLQNKATILVNPRPPDGEFTKYSFPSKIIEYMASGRPIIMYRLAGIPEDYAPYYISPEGVGSDYLAMCMKKTLDMSIEELNSMAEKAQSFVLSKKNATTQTKKILDLISKEK
ncbi:glycosyltransferase [Noviherbaspirillum malthae]|uniref:glycosyltransferase n=1 Tax=Noviherbaspirillum malthae TaxID=1260987 RepID=UPI00188F3ED4|nr:glycosyltransferase [Noviherbaspirillum malthae]